ncbi:MAG TPA: hypothetical protein VHL11_25335 [Phototrophicaceae bacterium]|nr:hypothetical protein [Phototrophicaceae bacterium]
MIRNDYLTYLVRFLGRILAGCLLLAVLSEIVPTSSLQLAYIAEGDRGRLHIMEIHLMDLDHQLSVILDQFQDHFSVPYDGNSILWWSPDGTKLAFLTDHPDQSSRELHILTLTDSELSPRIDADGVVTGTEDQVGWITLSWSPDSRTIAYTAWHEGSNFTNVSLTLDSDAPASPASSVSTITTSRDTKEIRYNGMWSPDGAYFAYILSYPAVTNGSLYLQVLHDPDAAAVRLTNSLLVAVDPYWSPDSTSIVFLDMLTHDLYRVNINQSDISTQRLVQKGIYTPVWSPDGTQLAYLKVDSSNKINLEVIDLSTLVTQVLVDQQFGSMASPAWSPERDIIAFTAYDTSSGNLYLINADGTNLRRIPALPIDEFSSAWRPMREISAP